MKRAVIIAACTVGAFLVAGVLIPEEHGSRIAHNETAAGHWLVTILSAQATFHKTDFYMKGTNVFANPKDGAGLPDLYRLPDGTQVGLIEALLALASAPGGAPLHGYRFTQLTRAADTGAYDAEIEFAVCATPAEYQVSGSSIFVMDMSGNVFRAAGEKIYPGLKTGAPVPPLSEYPSEKDIKARWVPLSNW